MGMTAFGQFWAQAVWAKVWEWLAGHLLLGVAALAALIAVVGMVFDRLHSGRRDLDKVSLIAWGKVSIFALIVAIACLAKGLRNGG
jgi:hypothetical protein